MVLSFAVWGIADVITGVGRTTVATIGDTEIGAEEFRREYQTQLDAYTARFRRRLTPAEARREGVEGQILSNMISTRAVNSHARSLNLSITDNAVEETVRTDPLFQGVDGKFSPERLSQILYQGGYTEQQFIEGRRADLVRDQLTSSMLENVSVPKILYEMYSTFSNEERVVRYFAVDPKLAKIATPTPEQLKKTYDENKSQFMTPETRQLEVLMVTAEDAKKKIALTEEALKEAYEKDKQSFTIPEERKVLQIAFKDKAAAEKAHAEITGGKSFQDVAKANGAKESDIDLGLLTKDKLIDPKIAEAAFKLEKDAVSGVVEGRFTTVLLKVTEIKPGKVQSFEEVKSTIRDRLASRQAPAEIRKLHDQVDDNRLAGKSLKEIGTLLDVTYKDIAKVERNGNGSDGKPAFKIPDIQKLVSTAFNSSVGVENEVIELSDGGYAWVRVLKVNKSELKPFDKITADVEKVWKEQEVRKAVSKLASDYVKQVKDGAKFEDVAKKAGAEVKTTPAYKRYDSLPNLPRPAAVRAFTLAKNVPASALTNDGKARVVFEVTEIKAPAKLEDKDEKQLMANLSAQLRTDVVTEYVKALRDQLGEVRNQRLIDQVVGIVPREGSF